LLLTEEAVRQWVERYKTTVLAGLQNHPSGGGEHGPAGLSAEQLEELKQILQSESDAGPRKWVAGGPAERVPPVIRERFGAARAEWVPTLAPYG